MSLFRSIKNDWVSHGKDWTRPGFRALVYYRFGAWRLCIRSRVIRITLGIIHRWLYRRARNLYGIELPETAKIGQSVVFEHQHGIIIHGDAIIGDGCIIRQGVTLGNRSLEDPLGAPVLGKNVNVGAGAKILGRVQIGDNANIGANSVVLHNVETGKTVVGIPAREI